ncbi:MAG: peptidyl-alpha-hydroxyglycine alpha-amidating lyase family protein [Kangiellaceae bacterium]|nr:peptidyl-alpha-hydroxyglycine alpha-amidating lyase family protein [Kangiellaceae bacterium]
MKLIIQIAFILICLVHYSVLAENETSAHSLKYRAALQKTKLPVGWYLGEATAIEFNSKGHFYVFNRGLHPLLEFDRQGIFVKEIGQGLFDTPHGMRVDRDDNIWTTDQNTHQVMKFNPLGELLLVIGRRNSEGTGWFDRGYSLTLLKSPSDVAFDSDGNVYVADAGNFRIVKFNRFGEPITFWGEQGDQQGEFNFPHSIIIDIKQRLLVTDRENARVQLFDLEGNYLKQWTDIGNPYLITQSTDGYIWVTDARAGKLIKLTQNGNIVGEFGEWGKQLGHFGFGHGLSVRDNGEIYISEVLNLRVQKLIPIK